jgi:predicted membrane metal-binding protein
MFHGGLGGHALSMVVTALILIVLGVVLGLFFPVMFVATLAGVVLLILFVVAGARRTKQEAEAPSSGVDTLR